MKQIYNEFNIFEFEKNNKRYYKFKEDLIKDVPGIFSYCQNNIELRTDLEYSGVFDPVYDIWENDQDNVVIFENQELAKQFVDRLNKYIKRFFDLL